MQILEVSTFQGFLWIHFQKNGVEDVAYYPVNSDITDLELTALVKAKLALL